MAFQLGCKCTFECPEKPMKIFEGVSLASAARVSPVGHPHAHTSARRHTRMPGRRGAGEDSSSHVVRVRLTG